MKLFSTAVLALHASVATAALSVSNTILVFARDSASATVATLGLQGYGIPYQTVIVPQSGAALPVLNSSATSGNYGGILVLSEVSYQYSTGFLSALTTSQWNQMFAYQLAFGVRMVRLDVFPTTDMGKFTSLVPLMTRRPFSYHHHQSSRILAEPVSSPRCHHGYFWCWMLCHWSGTICQDHGFFSFPHGQPEDVSWSTCLEIRTPSLTDLFV